MFRVLIRWSEVFLIDSEEGGGGRSAAGRLSSSPLHHVPNDDDHDVALGDPPDPTRAAELVARAVSVALLPHLPTLNQEQLSPLAVRVCLDLDPDNVSVCMCLRCLSAVCLWCVCARERMRAWSMIIWGTLICISCSLTSLTKQVHYEAGAGDSPHLLGNLQKLPGPGT